MSNLKFITILFFSFVLGACASSGSKSGRYDVVLYVKPLVVEPIQGETAMDAIEADGIHFLDYAVKFEVLDVLLGEFTKRRGGPSRFSQMSDAAKNKDVWKLFTLDVKDPNEQVQKKWVVVGVKDPMETFGFQDATHGGKYKLYLRKVPDVSSSYTLVNVKAKT